ncbi:hypothetical protein [Pelagibacterium xiamenense]|uniref:hypothetical protein n=1 Tax=Pelagibacterium xiamenense TaxID=2901140 RepID=UPI001E5BC6BB|nr:hypothetical protein [Pelagibacterium xiamenense]MCD7061042.1 hypothetical protein [Pelagibacterium xiamenense]
MNSTASRLRAIAVTALFFAASAFALLGAVWGLDALPFVLPGFGGLADYAPGATLAGITQAPVFIALSAAYLIAGAIVVLIDTQYCDRMLAIFADVLLMAIAAAVGFAAGYWIMLRLLGTAGGFDFIALRPIGICALIVFILSLIPPDRLRGNLLVRGLTAIVLLLAGPLLILNLG